MKHGYLGVLRRILRLCLDFVGQQVSVRGTGGGNGSRHLPRMISEGLFGFNAAKLRSRL